MNSISNSQYFWTFARDNALEACHLYFAPIQRIVRFFKEHTVFQRKTTHAVLVSELAEAPKQLDVWLLQGSEVFARDREVSETLIKIAHEKDARRALLLLGEIMSTPGLLDRFLEALRPDLTPRSEDQQRVKR
jgi:predicted glycoside hydrolase/deacetylase ChbG (UPF0249 family)